MIIIRGNNMSYDEFDIILAKTIYGEARGEYEALEGGLSSLIAIGNVVINRLNGRGFGRSVKEVCLKPFQFSCWNDGDPNKVLLVSIDNKDAIFRLCLDVAKKVIDGIYPDLTKKK